MSETEAVSETDAVGETDAVAETEPARRGAGRGWVVASALLAVVALGLGAALALTLRDYHRERDLRAAGEAAQKAARAAVLAITTYDHSSVEEDFGWVDTVGTEDFGERYAKLTEPTRALIAETKASAKGRVLDSAARVVDSRHVVVLLFVDQEITNEGSSDRSLDQPRVTLTMVKQDGRWLVDDLDLNTISP